MAKSRLYGWNGEFPEKPLSGQALIVFNGMRANASAMKTGHEWTELIGNQLATRQDPYRVVLYYILILKGRGVIKTNEFDIAAVTSDGEKKHGITVRTSATIEERHVMQQPADDVEEPDDDDELDEEGDEADGDDADDEDEPDGDGKANEPAAG